jgi:hypothetical protein
MQRTCLTKRKSFKNLKISIKIRVNVSDWWFVGHTWFVKRCEIGKPIVRWIFSNVCDIMMYHSIYLPTIYYMMWYSQYIQWITFRHAYLKRSTSLLTTACSNHWIIAMCLVYRDYWMYSYRYTISFLYISEIWSLMMAVSYSRNM